MRRVVSPAMEFCDGKRERSVHSPSPHRTEERPARGVGVPGPDTWGARGIRRFVLPYPHVGPPKRRVFLKEAAREVGANGRDWREALARVAMGGKPPTHWRDEDAEAFASRLRVLAVECDILSELVAATGGDSATTVASIGLLEPRMSERRTVIALSRDQRAPVADLIRTLQRAAERSGLDLRSQLMALAARDLLPADEETGVGEMQ